MFAKDQCRVISGVCSFVACTWAAHAQSVSDINTEQLRRAQERQSEQRKQQEIPVDVHLPMPSVPAASVLPASENPCFTIRHIELTGAGSEAFIWLLEHTDGHAQLPQPEPVIGQCVGARGVAVVMDRLQHALIEKGYVTSRVLATPQNLQEGTLKLSLVLGRVGQIRWAQGSGQRGSRWNSLPTRAGDVLNLRDIEQALENYKRVPSAEADIQITPGSEPGTSDLVISHQQPMPFRLSATADDSGSSSTGKYQGSLTLSYDNWWTLSDLFYLTLSHDLGGADPGPRGTQGHTLHYSVPIGYWLLALNSSANNYSQTVAGASQNYLYSGTSDSADIKLSRIVYRNSTGKTSLSLKGFQRRSNILH